MMTDFTCILNAIEQGYAGAIEKLLFFQHFDTDPVVFIRELGNDGLKQLERALV
jgi:hypothetical protein